MLICRIATTVFYVIAAITAIFFLDESNPTILERRRILQNLKEQHLDKDAYEEQKRRILFQLDVQRIVMNESLMHRIGNEIAIFVFISRKQEVEDELCDGNCSDRRVL